VNEAECHGLAARTSPETLCLLRHQSVTTVLSIDHDAHASNASNTSVQSIRFAGPAPSHQAAPLFG
jgi:hypothetical protein